NLLAQLDGAVLQRFVFVSSSAVYGHHGDAWVTEETHENPVAFNGEILLRAEQGLRQELPHAVVFRLAGLYGPGRTQLLQRLRSGRASVPASPAPWANRF